MAISNYDLMRNRMRGEFLRFDQAEMIRKFSLRSDDDYLYIPFALRDYRIGRNTGIVEGFADGGVYEADYNESMTIYDVLCYSAPDCRLAGRFCPANMLKGTVKAANTGGNMFQRSADRFQGRVEQLKAACARMGHPAAMSGDAAFVLFPFSFLPITLQYWEADEDFPACLKFMFDENVQDFMHFETTFFMVGHILRRLEEMMNSPE